jgi:hypothetical protein
MRRFRSEPWLAALLALAAVSFAYRVGKFATRGPFHDFRVMHRGAQALHHGLPLYDVEGMSREPFAAYYKYPPLFTALLEPLRPLGFRRASRVWLGFLLTCYFGALVLLCRTFQLRFRSPPFYLAAITALAFQPAIDSLWNGQMDTPLLFILSAVWAALANRRDIGAGALIALAAMLKVYPIYMASFLLLRRRWLALVSCAVTGLVLVAISIALTGWASHVEFVTRVLPINAGTTAWVENQSLPGLFARLYVDGRIDGPSKETIAPAATILGSLTGAAVLAATFLAGLRTSRESTVFGALVAALLLALPVAWIIYEALLLIPIFDLLSRPFESGRKGMIRVALLATAILLLAVGNHDTITQNAWVPQSYKLFGVLLVWALEMDSLRPWRARAA